MSYTEVESEGFFSRLSGAFGGIVVGLVLILISALMLFWNEKHYVARAQALAEGKGAVVDITDAKIDSSHEGKLVHLTADTKAGKPLEDAEFGVKADGLRLSRDIQFYEWVEDKETKERKKIGGGKEKVTTYTYEKKWVDAHVDSSDFKEKGHNNPEPPKIEDHTISASDATFGPFKLTDAVLSDLTNYENLPLQGVKPPAGMKLQGNVLYGGKGNEGSPSVGDYRISFRVVKPGTISVTGKQTGDSLEAYTTRNDDKILLVDTGKVSAAEQFKGAEASNSMFTWILRFVGWLLMCIGFCMLFGPIQVMADIIPFIGDLVGIGTGLFGFMIGSALSLVVIAVGWIVARPLIGMLMLGGALAAIGFAWKMGKAKR